MRQKLGLSEKKLKLGSPKTELTAETRAGGSHGNEADFFSSINPSDQNNQQKLKYLPELSFSPTNKLGRQDRVSDPEESSAYLAQPFVDLKKISSLDELLVLPLETLKSELKRLGLKTGGSLEIVAERLWSIKVEPSNILNPKYIQKL